MNPVLLKPQKGAGSQVILRGRAIGNYKAKDYASLKPRLMPTVLESLDILGKNADLVIVEGAGSPVETYLKDSDIVNMALAEAADLPVLMLGDVDPGGAIAALVGTHALLEQHEQIRVKGFLINKMRGDFSLFYPACQTIEERTGWPCAGLIGWFEKATCLPAEDSLSLSTTTHSSTQNALKVAVLRFPHIANFDDFDPLIADPTVDLIWVSSGQTIPVDVDVVILPGTKSTRHDLEFLYKQGWHYDLQVHLRRGRRIFGICGGYQMLGKAVKDPDGLEGEKGETRGLGFLDIDTVIDSEKSLVSITGRDLITDTDISGYEIHMGRTNGEGLLRPFLHLLHEDQSKHMEGAVSENGLVSGSYLHGLFSSDSFRAFWLNSMGFKEESAFEFERSIETTLDALADHLENSLDLERFLKL